MIQDDQIWVSKNKGNDKDEFLLVGRRVKGGYHIAALLDFCLGLDHTRQSQPHGFLAFYERWRKDHGL